VDECIIFKNGYRDVKIARGRSHRGTGSLRITKGTAERDLEV
jgi:hypothetical protein